MIVLLDEINIQRRNGVAPYTAVVEATVSRTRPVLMAATTTILGMVPLLFDIAFGGMAATIIFGLTFATLLTLFITPTLYAMFIKLSNHVIEAVPKVQLLNHSVILNNVKNLNTFIVCLQILRCSQNDKVKIVQYIFSDNLLW